jgi:comEA protein
MNSMIRSMMAVSFVLAVVAVMLSAGSVSAAGDNQSGVVNVNTASVEQLQFLPGVGPKKAKAIFEYRSLHPFTTVEELRKVKGIGPKMLERMRPNVVLNGDTTAKAVAKKSRRPKK